MNLEETLDAHAARTFRTLACIFLKKLGGTAEVTMEDLRDSTFAELEETVKDGKLAFRIKEKQ